MPRKNVVALSLVILLSTLILVPIQAISFADIISVVPNIINCTTAVNVDVTYRRIANDDDTGLGTDRIALVVYDAQGTVLSGTSGTTTVGTDTIATLDTFNFFNQPTARPFTVKFHDISPMTTAAITTIAGLTAGEVEDSFTFDPASMHPDCASLPLIQNEPESELSPLIEPDPNSIPPDDRLNFAHGDKSDGIIYAQSDSGISVYGIDEQSKGFLGANVPFNDLPTCEPPPVENQLLASSGNGQYSIWLLTTCEYQVNIGPDVDGKVLVTIWRGVPADASSIYFREFNIFNILDG